MTGGKTETSAKLFLVHVPYIPHTCCVTAPPGDLPSTADDCKVLKQTESKVKPRGFCLLSSTRCFGSPTCGKVEFFIWQNDPMVYTCQQLPWSLTKMTLGDPLILSVWNCVRSRGKLRVCFQTHDCDYYYETKGLQFRSGADFDLQVIDIRKS